MKVIRTQKFRKLAEAKGDDQYPSSAPRHDTEGQDSVIFGPDVGDTEGDIEKVWKKKKKKKKKRQRKT